MHYIDPVLWDGDTSVDVPAHMDWRNNFEGAFRPERWLSEETRPRYMFTFGTGAHLCIGMNLVYLVRYDCGSCTAVSRAVSRALGNALGRATCSLTWSLFSLGTVRSLSS